MPRVADGCVVHVLDPGSRVARAAAVRHVSAERRQRFEELLRLHVPTADEPEENPVARALRSGRIERVSQVPAGWAARLGLTAPETAVVERMELRSVLSLPLAATTAASARSR